MVLYLGIGFGGYFVRLLFMIIRMDEMEDGMEIWIIWIYIFGIRGR